MKSQVGPLRRERPLWLPPCGTHAARGHTRHSSGLSRELEQVALIVAVNQHMHRRVFPKSMLRAI